MSVHCHPQHPHLVAVGCWDGAVLVFDVRKTQGLALTHSSSATAGQHTRPVWAVAWQQEQHGSPLAFQSLSSDGRLLLWTLATAELRCQVTDFAGPRIPMPVLEHLAITATLFLGMPCPVQEAAL